MISRTKVTIFSGFLSFFNLFINGFKYVKSFILISILFKIHSAANPVEPIGIIYFCCALALS